MSRRLLDLHNTPPWSCPAVHTTRATDAENMVPWPVMITLMELFTRTPHPLMVLHVTRIATPALSRFEITRHSQCHRSNIMNANQYLTIAAAPRILAGVHQAIEMSPKMLLMTHLRYVLDLLYPSAPSRQRRLSLSAPCFIQELRIRLCSLSSYITRFQASRRRSTAHAKRFPV